MELKRLEKAIGDRWALVVVLAAVGVVAALIFGNLSNRNQSSLFEATAAVRFTPTSGIETLPEEIEIAEGVAIAAAGDLLAEEPDSFIVADLPNQRLTFVARGETRESATAEANALLSAYLSVDPDAGIPVDTLIADLEEEALMIEEQIAALQPGLTDEEVSLIAQHGALDAREAVINARLDELLIEESQATNAEERSAVETQRAFLNTQLTELATQRTALGPVPVPPEERELSVEDSLKLAALQSRLDTITTEYERYYLRQSGAGDNPQEQTVVADLTPEPTDPIVNASIGLVGGLVIAVMSIMFLNRTRRPVWLAEDVSIPLLGSVPARRVNLDTSENWYDTAEPGPRKTSIQAIRAAIEAQVPSSGATLGVTGHDAAPEGVQALAADLASSLASAGTSVLLIDANFDSRSPLGQYRTGGTSLAGVLGLNAILPEFDAQVAHAVEGAFRVRAGLSVIPSGPPPASPADALAGRQFRELLLVAQRHYDVVVVVVDDVETPAAQIALQRLGYGVLVLTPGTSTIPEVDGALRDVDRLNIAMLGSIFLGKLSRLPGFTSKPTETTTTPEPRRQPEISEPAGSPISRLENYPIPDEKTTAVVPQRSLDDLAADIGPVDGHEPSEENEDDDIGTQLMRAMSGADPERASASVARYLVSQSTDMVMARHGYGGLSSELIGAMSDYGFMPVRPLSGFRTPSSWLEYEIADEIGDERARELVASMESVLERKGKPSRIDDWLNDEYFARHLEETGGEPQVVHLMSPEGAVSVFVPLRRLSSQRLELLMAEVAGRSIDSFERSRSAAVSKGDLEQAAVYEGNILDVQQFERSVRILLGVDDEGVRLKRPTGKWEPDWSRGTRANLAALQAAGVLPFNVLSPDEMSDLRASA